MRMRQLVAVAVFALVVQRIYELADEDTRERMHNPDFLFLLAVAIGSHLPRDCPALQSAASSTGAREATGA